ncbi:MAG: extracellular solute-binding protein [Anaerolineales bacterium]|nr:extracellular solute-binding protein [Anaerolineales bacterium]
MSTIKDVAKHAGVSKSTVSNVLKGVSSVNLEIVQRVEAAIAELNYRPDAAAQRLKGVKSQNMGVILPNITDMLFAQIYSAAESTLLERGYAANLFLTHEVPEIENAIISRILSMKLVGLIIVTCQPSNRKIFHELLDSGIKIVFMEREVESLDCNYVGFRNDKSLHYATSTMLNEGCHHVGLIAGKESYTSERLCEAGYHRALMEANITVDPSYVRYTDYSNESGFKATISLLNLPHPPEAILCTSTQLAEGAIGAVRLASTSIKPRVVSLGEEIWNDNRYPEVAILPRASLQAGEAAANLLLDNVEDPAFFEQRYIRLNNVRVNIEKKRWRSSVTHMNETIRVAMVEGDMAYAVQSLLLDFKHKNGINVNIDILPHEELYALIKAKATSPDYDVFCIDILWLREFAANCLLHNFSEHSNAELPILTDIQPEFIDDFALYNGQIYAVPFMYCNQLLFYRKDLFENFKYRRMFFEQYKTELKPPKTWLEFNAVARFFTRAYNPESETEFGTTLGCRFSSAALCEFLPRLYAYDADVFDYNDRVVLDSPNAIKALLNYCESFRYASPGSPDHWWHEQVAEFASGKTAMMVLYSAYVSPLVDRSVSCVVGKIGFDSIPGGSPILGGWSFAINKASLHKIAALEFINWSCGQELSIPLTLLGNVSACKNIYTSNEIKSLYPWITKSLDVFPTSQRRELPDANTKLSIKTFEEIIARAVHDSVVGLIEPATAIGEAANKLSIMLKK